MSIHESGEMYLESIYQLQKQLGSVRSVDISAFMGYSKPSVSRAVGLLRSGGYIAVDKSGIITLTDTGMTVARTIYERHTLLSNLLQRLGVSPEIAARDACKLEHAISDESFQAIKKYIENNGNG